MQDPSAGECMAPALASANTFLASRRRRSIDRSQVHIPGVPSKMTVMVEFLRVPREHAHAIANTDQGMMI